MGLRAALTHIFADCPLVANMRGAIAASVQAAAPAHAEPFLDAPLVFWNRYDLERAPCYGWWPRVACRLLLRLQGIRGGSAPVSWGSPGDPLA